MATPVAAIASVVAFAAIHLPHFGVGGAIFIALWSVPVVALFLVFEDCTATTVMHMLNNTFAYIVVPLLLRP